MNGIHGERRAARLISIPSVSKGRRSPCCDLLRDLYGGRKTEEGTEKRRTSEERRGNKEEKKDGVDRGAAGPHNIIQ